MKIKRFYIKEKDDEILSVAFGPSYTGKQILEAALHQIKSSNYNFLSTQLAKQKDAVLITEKRIKELSKKGEKDGDANTTA